jgi:hypothetical protein
MRWGAAALALLLPASVALAEMASEEYASEHALSSPAERERARARIEAERQEETRREAARQSEAEAARTRAEAERARRPYAERLLEARCGSCHALDALANTRHTLLGWHLTIARMRWWNGASMSQSEALTLAAHLAERQPSRGGARVVEMLVLALPLVLVGGFLWWRRKRLSRPVR